MPISAKYHPVQLRDYSALFTRSEVLHWVKCNFKSINKKIDRYDQNWWRLSNATYLDYLKYVYSILEVNYQNEYIYKNTFLSEWLLSELGETNSRLFNEFRVGSSVADLAMFNGISKAFEIKTEFDTNNRLLSQLDSYKKVFNQVYLIIPESRISVYEKYDHSIGIIAFTSKNKDRYKLIRSSITEYDVDPNSIMDILHTREYKNIVKSYFGELPVMTAFNQFDICKKLICSIPKLDLNTHFIHQMKERGKLHKFSKKRHHEFNQINLFLKLSVTESSELINTLKTPIRS